MNNQQVQQMDNIIYSIQFHFSDGSKESYDVSEGTYKNVTRAVLNRTMYDDQNILFEDVHGWTRRLNSDHIIGVAWGSEPN